MPKFRSTERRRFDTDDPAYTRIVRVDYDYGGWPTTPGGHGFIEAYGTYKHDPDIHASCWRVAWDDSDDPYKGDWQSTNATYTKAQARAFLQQKLREITARRLAKRTNN